jgi:hypothetical protein
MLKQLLRSNYNFENYNVQTTKDDTSLFNTLYLDPEQDVKSFGFILEVNLLQLIIFTVLYF